jgi:hypothetical protein
MAKSFDILSKKKKIKANKTQTALSVKSSHFSNELIENFYSFKSNRKVQLSKL